MKKTNVFKIAIFLVLLTCLVGAVSAADDATDTLNAAPDDAISADTVQEDISTDTDDTSADDTLQAQDNNDELKTGTKTVDVNNFNELTNAINGAVQDSENDTYIINLNEGTYQVTSATKFLEGISNPNIIINGNNQILEGTRRVTFNNGCNITINDLTIMGPVTNRFNLSLTNVVLNGAITHGDTLNPMVSGVFLKITNSTLNNNIVNNEILIIGDDVLFAPTCAITDNGRIVTNDTNKLLPYLATYDGENTLENLTITTSKTNYGQLTVINCSINSFITNYGKIIFKNSTITNTISLYPDSIVVFEDDVIFEGNFNLQVQQGSIIIMNDTRKISPYMNMYYGDYILENATVTKDLTNNGNLTIINSTIKRKLTNNGNVVIDNNSTINSYSSIENVGTMTIRNAVLEYCGMTNTGTLILGDNITIGTYFTISGSGKIITDDMNRFFRYIGYFYGEATIVLDYNKQVLNYGNLTIENSIINYNESTYNYMQNYKGAVLSFKNCTLNTPIYNYGTLIISDDTIVGENFTLSGKGSVIINETHPAYQDLLDFVTVYSGNIVLNNKTIDTAKTNKGTLTLNNCTIDSTINNMGRIIIDDVTVFGPNAKITGDGEIVIGDITKILPIIDAINGNYIIENVNLTKSYIFDGMITLNNCTIAAPDNINYGTLNLKNCTVNVGENDAFLTNYGTVTISKDTKITGKIDDLVDGVIYEGAPKTYIVNDKTINIYFDEEGYLTSRVNPGDTLDIRGTIKLRKSLIINKPVNIISSTKDAYIDLNTTGGSYFGENPGTCFSITKDGAYTNVTGIYFHNTQLWIYNTHHVTLDGISAVVEDQRVGSGVGQTSIRENSSYITVKNSYFYTKNNEGSSTLVLAWANYCTLENNTIVGVGEVGNLLYLTTYNVDIPQGSIVNSYNKIINNRITGPDQAAGICFGICICGYGNLVDNNTLTYSGQGIMFQWGSGVTGVEQDESLIGSGDNIVSNNKLYGGCGVEAGDIVYNNYMEGKLSVRANSTAYNNTATGLSLGPNSKAYNNTISGKVTFNAAAKDATIENNTIKGGIEIPSTVTNVTLKGNEITGSIILDGSNNKLSNNRITTTGDYAVYSNKLGKNNNLTDNYMVANGKVGADAVSLRDESNTITDSTLATVIVLSAPSESVVNKSVQVTIKLMDKNGNVVKAAQVTVTSSAGSETVNLTDGTGVYQYTPTAIGEDTVTVKYLGNESFYPSTNSTKINVTAAPANQTENNTGNNTGNNTTPVIKDKVVLAFAKKPTAVSKKAKKLVIKATLKINGKVAANKKVTISVKGKKYVVKTNKKGVATLKLKGSSLKKLLKKFKAGKKISVKAVYGQTKASKKIKVKK